MRKTAIEQLRTIHSHMKAIRVRAEAEGRDLYLDEQETFDELDAEREELLGDVVFYSR